MNNEQNLNNTENQQLNIADVSIRYLPFKNINDLISKCEKMKHFHKKQSEIFRAKLNHNNINFKEIDDYTIAIDISTLSDIDWQIIKENDNSYFDELEKELGIVKSL